MKPRASCATTACASPISAAAACFRHPTRPAASAPSTTTSAPSTRRRRSAPNAWCWSAAACRKARATSRAPAPWCATALAAILPHARAAGCRSRSSRCIRCMPPTASCINTLAQALDLCDELGDGTGVAIDTYHVWWDPDLFAQIARAGAGQRILAHHICDWLVPTRHLLLDRGMMGDGVIDFRPIRRAIEAAGYHRPAGGRDPVRDVVAAAGRGGACEPASSATVHFAPDLQTRSSATVSAVILRCPRGARASKDGRKHQICCHPSRLAAFAARTSG